MAEIMGFRTSVGDGLVEWFRRRSWVINLLVVIFIPLGYLADVVQDAVMIAKCWAGEDLELIWHLAKYLHVGFSLLTGATIVFGLILVKPLFRLIANIVIGLVIGNVAWWLLFEPLKRIDWPSWAFLISKGI